MNNLWQYNTSVVTRICLYSYLQIR